MAVTAPPELHPQQVTPLPHSSAHCLPAPHSHNKPYLHQPVQGKPVGFGLHATLRSLCILWQRVQPAWYPHPAHFPGNCLPARSWLKHVPLEARVWFLALRLLEVTFPSIQKHPFLCQASEQHQGCCTALRQAERMGMLGRAGDTGQSGSRCHQVTPFQLDFLYPCVSCWESRALMSTSGACSGSCFVNTAVPSLAMRWCNFLGIIP